MGNLKEALVMTNELLQIVPFHQSALGNKKYYEDLIRAEGGIQLRGETERYIFYHLIWYLQLL